MLCNLQFFQTTTHNNKVCSGVFDAKVLLKVASWLTKRYFFVGKLGKENTIDSGNAGDKIKI